MRKPSSLPPKLTRPGTDSVVDRPRLHGQLDLHDKTPIAWLAGPPGAGKTTLISRYLETGKGSGKLAIPVDLKNSKGVREGFSSVEIDMPKNLPKLTLPVPIGSLPYIETITTDETAGTHDTPTPTPKGPQKKEHRFRVTTGGAILQDAAFVVPLQGGWRSQSGEHVVNLKGDFGEAGELVARWQFRVQ